jgi:hypothetical protein
MEACFNCKCLSLLTEIPLQLVVWGMSFNLHCYPAYHPWKTPLGSCVLKTILAVSGLAEQQLM